MLPVSLFGMAVSAAELPAMSSALGDHGVPAPPAPQRRPAADRVLHRALGDGVPRARRCDRGRCCFSDRTFTPTDSPYVWGILAGSAVGLLASTLGRLYASTYYALRDTRTPLRYADPRHPDHRPGIPVRDPAARRSASTRAGAWRVSPRPRAWRAGWNSSLLRRTLNRRIGRPDCPPG